MDTALVLKKQSGRNFLSANGEMGRRLCNVDWSVTPLGPAERWPNSLKTTISIMLSARQPMFIWWGSELINFYNDAYCPILGGRHPAALGRPAALVWPDVWDRLAPRAKRVMRRGEGIYDEAVRLIVERNGYPEEVFYTFSYSPIPDDKGHNGGVLCTTTDDTRRIIGERRLALLQELASQVIDAKTVDEVCMRCTACVQSHPDDLPFTAVYLIDESDGSAVLKGSSGIGSDHPALPPRLSGTDKTLWPWLTVSARQRPHLVSLSPDIFNKSGLGRDRYPPRAAVVLPISTAASRRGVLIAGLNPLRQPDAEYQHFLEKISAQIARAIAGAQAYEDERTRAQSLAQMDRSKTLFFSHVSRELRTPLTLLLAPLNELLSESPYKTPDYLQQQLELAARSGQRLLCLADVLQDFSSIETARMEAHYEAVDLSAFTAGIASMFKSIAKNMGVELIVDCPPLPQPVCVDPDMWEKIVLNLISNAFKYTRTGKIEVSLHTRDSNAVLEVRDTGTGIPPEKLPKLFDRFNCADNSPGPLDDDGDVNLAIVHELAKLNRATVSAASTAGGGSLFTVAIPVGTTPMQSSASRARTKPKIAEDTATSTRFATEASGHLLATEVSSAERTEPVPAQPPTTDTQLHHPHVLIVNDDADLRRYIRRLLSPLYTVSEAESDEQALDLLQREIPDLILADTVEPGRDGAKLLREVRNSVRTAAVPVITLAARSNEDARIDALYAGADDYLTKPFSARDLLARIDAQLSTSRLRSEILRRERVLRAEAEKLNEVALWLNAELDLYTLLQKVTDTATDLTGARIGAFFNNRVDSSNGSYELVTLCGVPRAAFEKLGVPRNTPLLRQTFRDGQVVRLDDIRANPRYGKNQPHAGMPEGHPPLCSYLAVPVISRSGEILGGLFFGHPQPGIFTDRAERLVLGIAAQAAVAIDNARLYGRAQREIDERKRAETALRQSEERYRDLIRDLPAAVYACANDGTLTLFNEASVELWGQVPIVGRSAWSGSTRMFTPDGRPIPPDQCPLALTLRDGLPRGPIEILIERPDTSRRSVIAHPRPLRDSSGAVTGAINMLVDITDRKLAEAQLAAAKDDLALQVKALTRLHQLAMEPASTRNMEPSLRVTLETAVELHGADFGQILLYDRSAGVLRTASSIGFTIPMPERMACFTPGPGTGASGDAFVSQRRAVVFDTENDSRFASIREIARAVGLRSVHSTPIVARSDGIVGVLAVYFKKTRIPTFREVQLTDLCASHAANIVETAATQQALRESQRLYHAIGESINYGVWTCDPQGRNTYVSPSFLRLVGMTQEECSGVGWAKALHPDETADTLKAWQECVKSGDNWDRQMRLRDVHGRYHTVLARGVPVKNDRGEIVAWSGINLDITRLKAVEKNLRNANQRKNEFLATLAHELRNPLAPLLNGLELIKRGNANPQIIEKARQMMERQLRHMVRLIDDLLDLSRITEGKIELRKERIDLSLALQNAVQTCRPLIEQREQILTVDIPASPLIVDADMTRLEQIFANLLNNAAKYTHEGGAIHLRATRENDKVIVSLRDNGIGIPPEMLERIFDMFVQVDRSLEKIHSGLGIGLTLVKRLVRMHGGTVEAHSAGPGHGSEFIVKLPAALPEAAVSTHIQSTAPDGSTESAQRRRVLVVDDNPDCANSLAMMLELSGAEVRVASDGLDAVEAAAAFSPDLVLMDICMPRMNGYDACRRMRRQAWSKNSIIVALTGRGQADDVRRSHEVGFNGHLVKPVPPEAIGQLMSTLNPAPSTEKMI